MESLGTDHHQWELEFMQYCTVFPVQDDDLFNISSFSPLPQLPNLTYIHGDTTTLFCSMNTTTSGDLKYGYDEESSHCSHDLLIHNNNLTANYNHVAVPNDFSVYSMDFAGADEDNKSILCVVPDTIMEDAACAQEYLSGNNSVGADLLDSHSQSGYDARQLQLDQKLVSLPEIHHPLTLTGIDSSDNLKKRTRVPDHEEESDDKKKKKKYRKVSQKRSSLEESINGGSDGQSSSGCSSEDENTSEPKTTSSAANLNGKTRASRGTATDPQSLYARKRRERINERLRILQTLVPNGTKVDISTMLEEAVHYVKFLQLQIKLLSSDDLWMYAPIAYNGMDIGLLQKISPLL